MQASNSQVATSYELMGVSGMRKLDQGDFVSCWIYSEEDTSFSVNGAQGGFHVAQISNELPSINGGDPDVEAGGTMFQEVFGHPMNHDSADEGWNHVASEVAWGTCGQTRGERIQCCADECVRLGPAVCSAFAIRSRTREDAPTECHYITSEDMPGTCMQSFDCIVDTENFGYGWGTWIPSREHGWDAITSSTQSSARDCSSVDAFFARADEVNNVKTCCPAAPYVSC